MRKAMNLFLLGGLSLLALAGCNKEGLEQKYSRAAGEEIVFGAVSRSYGIGTKTVYGDAVKDGERQQIQWQPLDQFRVYSNKAKHRYNGNSFADYQIAENATITNSDSESKVSFGSNPNPGILPVTEYELESGVSKNGLVWENGEQEFYAIYPVSASADGVSGILSAAIPSEQAAGEATNIKNYGIMTAYAKASGSTTNGVTGSADGAVELAFDPAFTAFEITLKAAADETEDIVLNSFELQSGEEALAGDFTVSYKDGTAVYTCPNATDATDANKKISVTFPNNTKINANKEFTFTVFALPQDFTKLTLSFTVADGEGSVTRKLPLTYVKTEEVEEGETPAYTAGDYVKFDGLKKHRLIGLALSKYKWVFEAVNLDLKWDVDTEALNYDSNPIINAGALYYVSGVVSDEHRDAATFASTNPIVEYFTVFSPKNGKWVVTNSAPTIVTLSAADATPSEDGTELSGPINGRVDLSIARGSATGTADLNFYVEVGGRRYCINSEVTRSGAQVITNN